MELSGETGGRGQLHRTQVWNPTSRVWGEIVVGSVQSAYQPAPLEKLSGAASPRSPCQRTRRSVPSCACLRTCKKAERPSGPPFPDCGPRTAAQRTSPLAPGRPGARLLLSESDRISTWYCSVPGPVLTVSSWVRFNAKHTLTEDVVITQLSKGKDSPGQGHSACKV